MDARTLMHPTPPASPPGAIASADGLVSIGQVVAGKYRVERILGAGGMGVVVAALDQSLGRRVALKVLHPALAQDARMVERFLREARAATQITSEHVVGVFEVGQLDSGSPFLAMEYLEGQDLRQVLQQRGPLPVQEAVGYVMQAMVAIAEAHAKGIVHRDLKPANLFLAQRADGTRLVKVLDFGIAKAFAGGDAGDSALTQTQGSAIGSPIYMSPEQVRTPNSVDARTDIWALGVVLQELLTGHTPFTATTSAGLFASIVTDPPTPARSFRANLPQKVDEVLSACLQKDPAARVASVAALAQRLAPLGGAEAQAYLRRIAGFTGASAGAVASATKASSWPVLAAVLGTLALAAAGVGWFLLQAPASAEVAPSQPSVSRSTPPAPTSVSTADGKSPAAEPAPTERGPNTKGTSPPSSDEAEQLPELDAPVAFTYHAVVGPRDHCNSRGTRLESAAQILRQERANFHRQRGDEGDGVDPVFADPAARVQLEQLVREASFGSGVEQLIVDNSVTLVVRLTGSKASLVGIDVQLKDRGQPVSGCR